MRIVYVNGVYLSEDQASVSIFDRGFLFADAVYEISSVLEGKLVDNAAHLARLDLSLKALSIKSPVSHREIETIQNELIIRNQVKEGIVYIQISRGPAERDFAYPTDATPTLVMFTQEKVLLDSPLAVRGMKIITRPDIRWRRRDIKTISLLAASMAKQEALSAGADDVWMMEDGYITEGSSNNAFIIDKNRHIITRQLSRDILHGITRNAIMQLCAHENLVIDERPFTLEEVYTASEAFITSASAFVMPVVQVDKRIIGRGSPGELTLTLRRLYIENALSSEK